MKSLKNILLGAAVSVIGFTNLSGCIDHDYLVVSEKPSIHKTEKEALGAVREHGGTLYMAGQKDSLLYFRHRSTTGNMIRGTIDGKFISADSRLLANGWGGRTLNKDNPASESYQENFKQLFDAYQSAQE